MERTRAEWERRGIRIVAVGPGGERGASLARRGLSLGFPLVSDPRTQLARRFGLRRLLGLLQESGVAVLGAGGLVRMVHRTANPGAALPLDEVRRALADDAPAEAPPGERASGRPPRPAR